MLERSDRCVEAGMQDRRISLGGAVQYVDRLLDDGHARAGQRESPGDGTADDAGANDGDVEATRQC